MIDVQLKEEDVFNIMTGSLETRMEFFASDKILSNIDIEMIKKIYYQKLETLDNKKAQNDTDIEEIIIFLQYIAYNRKLNKDSEKIATFVMDKLFELYTEGSFS